MTDPSFEPSGSVDYFVAGRTPYYVAREASALLIERTWQAAGSAAGALAIVTAAEPPRETAGPQILDLLATHVTDLVVEAYDHPKLVIFLSRNDKLACSGTSIKKG